MKYSLILLSFFFFSQNSFACSCEYIPPFCEVSKNVAQSGYGLIWVGEYIQKDSIDEWSHAFQFRVESIVSGEIITASSPLVNSSTYQNTDSTIWVIGGEGSLCYRWYEEGKGVFATNYSDPGFGYNCNICSIDYLPVQENDMVKGHLWSIDAIDSIHINDIPSLLTTPCIVSDDLFADKMSKIIDIFPNPTHEIIHISTLGFQEEIEIQIHSLNGRLIKQSVLSSNLNHISLNDADAGIYLISFRQDDHIYTEKIIKY